MKIKSILAISASSFAIAGIVWAATSGPNTATVEPTSSWTLGTENAQWAARSSHMALVFSTGGEKRMWLTGGNIGGNDVWYSLNGSSWTQATAAAQWRGRGGLTSTVFNNQMWVLGPEAGPAQLNEVWRSTNGVTWTQATAAAQWGHRDGAAAVTFTVSSQDRMWFMGGADCGGGRCNDVWYSVDGISWTQATAAAQWKGRANYSAVVLDNKMWVMGGASLNPDLFLRNDVWYSVDGISWTQATAAARWSGQGLYSNEVVAYEGEMWLIGGVDIWRSLDGINWTLQATAPWNSDFGQPALVFNGDIWKIGGSGSGVGAVNDVWYFGDGTDWIPNGCSFNANNCTTSSNDFRAEYNSTLQEGLPLKGFGISLPTGATVNGITVTIEVSGTENSAPQRDIEVILTKNGSTGTGTLREDVRLDKNTDSVKTLGSSSDLWGTSWTEAEIESANFGVIIRDDDTTVGLLRIDQVQVTVDYTP